MRALLGGTLFAKAIAPNDSLESKGITQCHPSFLQFAPTLTGCSKRHERFCQQVRHHSKEPSKCDWGKRLLPQWQQRSNGNNRRRRRKQQVAPGQQQLPFALEYTSLIPEQWQQIAQQHCRYTEPR